MNFSHLKLFVGSLIRSFSFEKFLVVVDVFACDACGRDRTFRCASRSAAACVSKHSKRDEILRLHITGAALEDGRCSRKRHAQNIATQSLRSEALVAFNQLITLKCTALLHLKETHGPSCPLSRFKTQQLTHKNHKTCQLLERRNSNDNAPSTDKRHA